MKFRRGFVLMIALGVGCARLPTGPVTEIAKPSPYRVILIRGFLDWYSTGIDRLADELKRSHIDCAVFRDDQWHAVADQLVQKPTTAPLVLIGFSYGADDVISIARKLAEKHRNVSMLITIDPVTPGRAPANVECCVNYYEPNGVWDVFPWLRGIPLSADGKGPSIDNVNIRKRADLYEPNTRHATIAANEKVHAAIIAEIKRSLAMHQL